MAKMKKCYYCDFDEYGDSTYEQKDLFKAKIGKIQGDCIFMRSVINESLERKQAEICTFLEGDNKPRSVISDIFVSVTSNIHYCPMCGRRLAEDWEKEET